MQSYFIALTFLLASFDTQAQSLKLETTESHANAEDATILNALGLTGSNKPNGFMYRLRQYIDPELPTKIPSEISDLQLFIAEPTDDGWLCLYRTPMGDESNYYQLLLFKPNGKPRWQLDLNLLFTGEKPVEVQDVRYRDGLVYYNEACQSYSKDVGGECSRLVCVDPKQKKVVWKTPYLTSNDIFLVTEEYVITGYGFTDEPDFVFLVDRKTGKVLDKQKLQSKADYMEIKDGQLYVVDYRKTAYIFSIQK